MNKVIKIESNSFIGFMVYEMNPCGTMMHMIEQDVKTSRRKREKDRHRQEILKVAVELLLEKGFEKTTMQDIADRAEFAVGTLYRFFKGKKELFEELMLENWHDVDPRLREALDSSDDELECLRAYNRVSSRLILEYKSLTRIFCGNMIRYNLDLFAGVDGEVRMIMNRLLDRLEEVFRSGIQKGIFVDLNPRILAICYDTLVGSYMTVVSDREEPIDIDTWMDTVDRMFFDAVIRRPVQEPGVGSFLLNGHFANLSGSSLTGIG